MTTHQRLERVYAFAETHKNAFLLGGVLLALYVSCFLLAPQMGLYADDYRIARQWGAGHSYDWNITKLALLNWPQGRPLIGLQISIFGNLAWELGGVRGVYILSYMVLGANAVFTFLILRQISPVSVAFLGALMMVLYPADAAKMTYIRTVQVQFVVLLFLAATWTYLKGHRIWPYLLMIWSVGLYETVILPFFFVPALRIPWSAHFIRHQIRHAGILVVILCGIVGLRLLVVGDANLNKATNYEPAELLMRSLTAVVLGTVTSAKLLVLRCYTAIEHITWTSGFVMGLVGLVVAAGLMLALRKGDGAFANVQAQKQTPGRHSLWLPLQWPPWVQLMSAGFAMWLAAYPLFVAQTRFPPTVQLGRITSVHSAAEIGVSFVAAGLFWLAVSTWNQKKQRRIMVSVIALYFALLAGFQVLIQSELADAWVQQKSFWRAVIRETPDLEPHSLIVVNPLKYDWQDSEYAKNLALATQAIMKNPKTFELNRKEYEKWIPWSSDFHVADPTDEGWQSSKYAEIFPWNLQFILPQIVTVGPRKDGIPRAVWVWQMNPAPFFGVTVSPENNLEVRFSPFIRGQKNMQGQIIWLDLTGERQFKRAIGKKDIQDIAVNLKPRGPSTRDQWIKGPLYEFILDD